MVKAGIILMDIIGDVRGNVFKKGNSLNRGSGHSLRFLTDNKHKRCKSESTRSSVDVIDSVILSTAAVIAAICLYLNWIVLHSDSIRYESLSLLQLSGDAGVGLIQGGLESFFVAARVVIIATTVFWTFFIWRIIVFSPEHIRVLANLAGVLTVLLAIGVSLIVSALNSSNYETNGLHSGILEIDLSAAPFIAAVCSITIMLLVSLKYRRHKKSRQVGVYTGGDSPEEDIEVRISTDADYRLIYNGRRSVGFIADMGDVKTISISPDVSECVIRGISEELKICAVCGEFIRYRVSSCTNCGNTIPKERVALTQAVTLTGIPAIFPTQRGLDLNREEGDYVKK